jgi:hypothetical protein
MLGFMDVNPLFDPQDLENGDDLFGMSFWLFEKRRFR